MEVGDEVQLWLPSFLLTIRLLVKKHAKRVLVFALVLF